MSLSPSQYVAIFDSSASMLKATANYLAGRDFANLGHPAWQRLPTLTANRLPRRIRNWIFAVTGAQEGIARSQLAEVSLEAIGRWAAGHYPQRRYPAVAVGSSNGAFVHLAAALRIPWLPQTFLIPVKERRVPPDEPRAALALGRKGAEQLLRANPGLQLHHMHDPNQDRLMLQYMSYFRVKARRLPDSYKRFLANSLQPGGSIVVVDCRRSWPVTRLGRRHVFQTGALGGATEQEFFEGGPRVADYLRRYGVPQERWDSPSPNDHAPEAEWGFEPELAEDIEGFARRRGYRVVRVAFDEPEHLSPAVADLYRAWYRRRGMPAKRLVAESFNILDPYWVLRTGSVPFWMKFNMQPSADWLERYLDQTEPWDEIGLMLFSNGIEGAGWAPIERWCEILRRARRRYLLGVDPERYPSDFGTYARYSQALRALPSRYPLPGPLALDDVLDSVADHPAGLVRVEG